MKENNEDLKTSLPYIIILIIFIIGGYYFLEKEKAKDNSNKLVITEKHAELEKLEQKIKYLIAIQQYDSAFILLPNLTHNSMENMPPKNYFDLDNETYSNYWSQRRNYIADLIAIKLDSINNKSNNIVTNSDTSFMIDTDSLSANINQNIADPINTVTIVNNTNIEINQENRIYIPDQFIGLYLKDDNNGNTSFYKIVKNDIKYYVIYQENESGQITVNKFNIINYSDIDKKIDLVDEKNTNKITYIKVKQDNKSVNGYILLDAENNEFVNLN